MFISKNGRVRVWNVEIYVLEGLKVILLFSDPSANGTPSSKSLVITAAKSLKKSSSSLAYLSTCALKDLSDTRAMSVGSIMRDL